MADESTAPSQSALLRKDIRDSLAHWQFWFHLGLDDILKQYRRSFLGPVWISLNTALFILAFSLIGAQIFRVELREYLVYFCVGHIVFLFLSSLLTEGCQCFIAAQAFLKQTPYPKLVFVLRVLWRCVIVMAHNLPVLLLVVLLFGDLGAIRFDLLLLGWCLTIATAVPLLACLGAVCARYRDVPMLVGSVMQIAMFITPVMWRVDQLTDTARAVVYFNPIAAYLELLRAPLMGAVPGPHAYAMALGVLAVSMLGLVTVFRRSRRRLVYWL